MAVIKELIGDFKFIFSFRKEKMKEQLTLNKKAPKTGDPAPDFTLRDISGERSVTLSEFQGKKPVALVFGSFT
jgi:peroxiredoxin